MSIDTYLPFFSYSKELGNRIADITDQLSAPLQEELKEKGWGVYFMNMTMNDSKSLVFCKDNERGYQPYFGSTGTKKFIEMEYVKFNNFLF